MNCRDVLQCTTRAFQKTLQWKYVWMKILFIFILFHACILYLFKKLRKNVFFCKGSNKFAAIHCVQRAHLSIQKVMKAMNSSARPPNNHPEIEKFV